MDRADFLNYLIHQRGYRSYLEIGCERNWCFDRISVPDKVGVDPVRGGTWRGTSDAFFAQNTRHFDLILVDGDHSARARWRDCAARLLASQPATAA
jgi:hypothetical protein